MAREAPERARLAAIAPGGGGGEGGGLIWRGQACLVVLAIFGAWIVFASFSLRLSFSIAAFVNLALLTAASPAWAIDCSKAQTAIEQAICSDPVLKKKDEAFAGRYFSVLKILIDGQHQGKKQELLDGQRTYLMEREKTCGALSQPALSSCLQDSMDRRLTELANYDEDSAHEFGVGDTIIVGTERLPIAHDRNKAALKYKGRTLFEADDGSDWAKSFTLLDKWQDAGMSAVLVDAFRGGMDRCSEIYVLVSKRPGNVEVADLDDSCLITTRASSASKTSTGFENRTEPAPDQTGSVVSWEAATGKVQTKELYFEPQSGTKIADLLKIKDSDDFEPLKNEEFYNQVKNATQHDAKRFLSALWNPALGWSQSCGGDGMCKFVGLHSEGGYFAYSGCGFSMHGMTFECGGDDALAVIETSTRKLFFAITQHIDEGKHTPESITLYPALKDWPAGAQQLFVAWRDRSSWKAVDE